MFTVTIPAPGDNATFYAIVDGTTDTLVSYSGDNANWVELTADLSAYAGQTIAIQIQGNHNTMTGSQFYNAFVDDFYRRTPSCFAHQHYFKHPFLLEFLGRITTHRLPRYLRQVLCSWFHSRSETETFVPRASESFTGLAEETTYEVYVRANCGANKHGLQRVLNTPPSASFQQVKHANETKK